MAITAAIVGGVGAIGGATISGNAAQSAADTQAAAANQASATQLQIYNQTRASLAPYLNTGTSALAQLANLFGLSPVSSLSSAQSSNQPNNGFGVPASNDQLLGGITNPSDKLAYAMGGTMPGVGSTQTGGVAPAGGATASGIPNAAAATSALTQFPGYQFGLQQGYQALDRSAAARGMLLSGAQLKDAQQFGQGYAMQNAWNPYISQLNSLASLGENAGATTGNQGVATGQGVAQSQLAAGQAAASGIVGSANAMTSGLQGGLNSGLMAYLFSQNGGGGGGGFGYGPGA